MCGRNTYQYKYLRRNHESLHTRTHKNEIHIRKNAGYHGTSIRNVPWQQLPKPLRQLSKQQRHYRCRTVGTLYPTIPFSKGKLSMKNFINTLYRICLSIGQARAAAAMARAGMHKEAREMMAG